MRALWRIVLVAAAALGGAARAESVLKDEMWPSLKRDLFQDRAIAENSAFLALDAPMKADDAALVPIAMTLRNPPGETRRVVRMTLVIDDNPVPLAGTFTLGAKSDVVQITTRVRVNADTYLHLVAELSDGTLAETKRYVRAAGGCSSPSGKGAGGALAGLGQLKFRLLPDIVRGHREAVVMIRHPNFTGMQMDEATHDYTPARYVNHFAVYQDSDLVFAVDGGISISEDPNFRFAFAADEARTLRVEADDIAGAKFSSAWRVGTGGG